MVSRNLHDRIAIEVGAAGPRTVSSCAVELYRGDEPLKTQGVMT
jgi:hypothetical protein